jgi:hypothetical protein
MCYDSITICEKLIAEPDDGGKKAWQMVSRCFVQTANSILYNVQIESVYIM